MKTNEWGPPLTGEEMKALKGRIDPGTPIQKNGVRTQYRLLSFEAYGPYCLLANHPYYRVREYNQRHGTNLVLHDGSAKVPEGFDPNGLILFANGQALKCLPRLTYGWSSIIAYTPKPKENEVAEQFRSLSEAPSTSQVITDHFMKEGGVNPFDAIMPERKTELREQGPLPGAGLAPCEQIPKDEAIEYVRQNFGWHEVSVDEIKRLPEVYKTPLTLARLIQQYEPDRLKSAVDVAAEEYAKAWTCGRRDRRDAFKAGAAWRLNNPTA